MYVCHLETKIYQEQDMQRWDRDKHFQSGWWPRPRQARLVSRGQSAPAPAPAPLSLSLLLSLLPPPPPQMPADVPTIRKLPESVALRLRSTLVVTSLSDAVFQLVQNSLDADARSIRVQANLARNSCVVEDDGVGIQPVDMGMVGQMYGQSPAHGAWASWQLI